MVLWMDLPTIANDGAARTASRRCPVAADAAMGRS
jgi:hypothetical protein